MFCFVDYQLPECIINRGIGDKTLQRFLSWQFKEYEDSINIQVMTHQIINHWLHVKREGVAATTQDHNDNSNSNAFGRVFPLEVTLHLWNSVIHYDYDYAMVPASEVGIEKMLKTVKFEEIVLESATTCVICLEEITTMPNQDIDSGMLLLQIPCLHVFHGRCIKKWLNNSHYCPTCRFQMPTNSTNSHQ
ncbi:RING-H2 finger protein ATL47-like [Momordica charantia]|uniref:RING-type E3 ubiquitin transferase n=1 Tax=Momordica charantia TaxID=3673 RepID=A0A6J1DWD8_MOMCH|nr:RING-H2 finger protein ATL47-like [Momordica charantia]